MDGDTSESSDGESGAPSQGPGLWTLAGLGVTAGVSVALFVGGGLWLDSVTGRSPLFALLGVLVGVVVAVLVAYREIKPYL